LCVGLIGGDLRLRRHTAQVSREGVQRESLEAAEDVESYRT
jgi:hypothetical protein